MFSDPFWVGGGGGWRRGIVLSSTGIGIGGIGRSGGPGLCGGSVSPRLVDRGGTGAGSSTLGMLVRNGGVRCPPLLGGPGSDFLGGSG